MLGDKNTLTLKTLYILPFLFVAMLLSPGASAQNVCDPPEGWFGKIQSSYDRNIRETAVNHLTSSVVDFTWTTTTGTEMAEFMNCTDYVSQYFPEVQSEMQAWGCSATDEDTCRNIVNQFVYNGQFDRQRFASSKVSGSILGLAYYLDNNLKYEPLPVSTAFFFLDYGKKIPIVGEQAFAADSVDYQHTFINAILDIWKITRNIAYALMALIMLYVGITIITRRRINQQVVVNVQYALPKIVVALVLIAFSYPIGAFMTSLAWSLYYSAQSIIASLAASTGGGTDYTASLQGGIGAIAMVIIGFIIASGGSGLAVGIIVAIAMVILFGMYLFALFKALMIYMKMITSIVTAPLKFALSAIPGNDSQMINWFKQMIAWGLGIVAISATIQLIHMFGIIIIRNGLTPDGYFQGFSGYLYAVFGILFIFIFGYGYAFKVPDLIYSSIMNEKKGR
ncbi:hypothetical protein C4561_03650 [candidate division WWE3 bacterium]|jgi:hypothetical protein|uniref:Type IV secretion system protein n=1 Tax=candidate division WWE3 bacterium TaxID=2053526 RepID=A0A3A4ZCF8_UNCKA|nr:MAG: hypothetical protein C4561_03650 [candidate division WWE3 bacterium]